MKTSLAHAHETATHNGHHPSSRIRDRAPDRVRYYHGAFLEAVERGDEDVATHCAHKRNWWLSRLPQEEVRAGGEYTTQAADVAT